MPSPPNEQTGSISAIHPSDMSNLHLEGDCANDTSNRSDKHVRSSEWGERVVLSPMLAGVSSWSFWCRFAKWPIVFLLLNVIVFVSCLSLGKVDTGLRRFSQNTLVTGITCVMDAILLYLASIFLTKQLAQLDQGTSNQGTTTGMIHGLASRILDDKLFGKEEAGRRHRRGSIMVDLLYLAIAFTAAASLTSFAYAAYATTNMGREQCSSPATFTNRLLDGIPPDLQTQVRRDHGADDRGMYAHMTDGATYFAANNRPPSMQNDLNDHFTSPTYLLATQADGSIRAHEQIAEPRMFRTVAGDSDGLATNAFCCTFSEVSYTLTTKIMCRKAFEDVSLQDGFFRNVTLTPIPSGWYLGAESAMAYQGEYWYARRFSRFPVYAKGEKSTQETTEFYKVKPETMEMDLIDSLSIIREDVRIVLFRPAACRLGLEIIGCFAIGLVLFSASGWMVYVKQMPVGIAPACVATFTIAACVSVRWTMTLVYLLVPGACVACFWPRLEAFGREALVWMIYTLLAFVPVVGTLAGHWSPILWTGTILVVAIALDHPVFQIAGWAGGIVAVLMGMFSFIGGGGAFGFILIGFGVVGGLGLVSLGSTLRQYHSFLQLLARAPWPQWIVCSVNFRRVAANLQHSKLSRKSSYDAESDSKTFDLTSRLLQPDDV